MECEFRRRPRGRIARRDDRGLLPPARRKAAQERFGQSRDPARKHQDDGDEEQRHQHFPERQAVAQLRGERADEQRADDRAEQARAAADRGPDHKFGREAEADHLRRDDPLLRRIDRAADAGHQSADAERHGFELIGVEAEQLQATLVLRQRPPEHADRRVVEPAGKRQHGEQDRGRNIIDVGDVVQAGQTGNALEPVEAAGDRIPGGGDLEGEQGERQRNHREISAALARTPKHQGADQIGQQAGGNGGKGQDQNGDNRSILKGNEGEAREIGREPEEQGLAKRQKSRLPPAQADADRGHRIERVEAELIGPELPEQKRQDDGDENDDASRAQRFLAASAIGTGWRERARRNSRWRRWSRPR